MTNTNIADTIVHESPSLLRIWWSNKKLRYDVAMSSIIIILNIAAIVYIRTHTIHLNSDDYFLIIFTECYVMAGLASCWCWFMAIEDVTCSEYYFFGRISHTFGFGIFLVLLKAISPHLALHFGLPFLLWFVPVMIAPCCPWLWEGLCEGVQNIRDWWKHVNQPQQAV